MGQVLSQNHFVCEGEDIKEKAIIISKTEMLNNEETEIEASSIIYIPFLWKIQRSTQLN